MINYSLMYEAEINSDDNYKRLEDYYTQFCPALDRGKQVLEKGQAEEVKQALEQIISLAGELRSCGVNSPLFIDFAQELIALLDGRKPIEEAEDFERDARAFLEAPPQE